jgi:hypothetical protein
MTKRLIGLDGEMSDSELADGAVLIQIGAAFDATERFSAILRAIIAAGPRPEFEMEQVIPGVEEDDWIATRSQTRPSRTGQALIARPVATSKA